MFLCGVFYDHSVGTPAVIKKLIADRVYDRKNGDPEHGLLAEYVRQLYGNGRMRVLFVMEAKKNHEPKLDLVGVGMVVRDLDHYRYLTYVKPDYRKQGGGTQMIKRLRELDIYLPDEIEAYHTETSSRLFTKYGFKDLKPRLHPAGEKAEGEST